MEIGAPVKELPQPSHRPGSSGRGKYEPIRQAAREATPDWVPVTFAEEDDAKTLASGATWTFTRHGFQVRRRGTTVYVRYLNGSQPQK